MARLGLLLGDAGATEERLDQLARDLVRDIRQLDVDFVGLVKERREDGAKGWADDVGHVLVGLSTPTSILALTGLLREWLRRRQSRRIVITDDGTKKTIEITGPTDQQLQQFVESYVREQDSRPSQQRRRGPRWRRDS